MCQALSAVTLTSLFAATSLNALAWLMPFWPRILRSRLVFAPVVRWNGLGVASIPWLFLKEFNAKG